MLVEYSEKVGKDWIKIKHHHFKIADAYKNACVWERQKSCNFVNIVVMNINFLHMD